MVWPIVGVILKGITIGGKVAKVAKVAGAAAKAGKAVGGFAKGAALQGVGMKGGVGKAVGAGRKTVQVVRALKGLGGGETTQAAPTQTSEVEVPQRRKQTLWTKNIGGNPSHYATHIKKKGKAEAGKKSTKPIEKKVTKKVTKTPDKPKKRAPVVPDRPITPREGQFDIDPSILGQFDVGGAMAEGGRGPFMQRPGGEAVPPAREVEEPFWSKAVSGTARFLTAGAPAPLRGQLERILPSSRYAEEEAKLDEQRDTIWQHVIPKVNTRQEIKEFTANPTFVDAMVARIPEISNKKDVESFFNFALREGLRPDQLLGESNWNVGPPTEGSIQAQVGNQPINITPKKPPRYATVADTQSLYNTETGQIETKSVIRQRWTDFKKQYISGREGRTELDAHFAFAGLNSGRFETSVVGKSLVRTDIYTGDQLTITPKQLDKSNIERVFIRDKRGVAIGIFFYDLDEIDKEGNYKPYSSIMFADVIAANRGLLSAGAGPDGEAGDAGLLPQGWNVLSDFIKDVIASIMGVGEPEIAEHKAKDKTKKPTKKSKPVNRWLEGS